MTMGERPGMAMYPAAMTALQPATVAVRWQPAKVTAAVLCFVSLVLVVVSSFLPLYSGELTFDFGESFDDSDAIEITVTPWSAEYSQEELNDAPGDIPMVGYPLVFGAVFIACAAFACWYAATPAAGRTADRAAGVVTAVSSAFLVGTVWTTAMLVTNGVDNILLLGTLGNGVDSEATYLVGYWLLLTAVLLTLAAAVMSLRPNREPAWQPPPPVNPFAPTPPYGIALPLDVQTGQGVYVDSVIGQPPPFPQAGQAMPAGAPVPVTAVDPLTGQPLAPPMTVDPLTGEPITPLSPPTGVPASAQPVPFTPEPVGLTNGTPPAHPLASSLASSPDLEPPPIVIPDAPPPPETPPGPAIPASEDPLAEPPRT
jgi:hypothetical protein